MDETANARAEAGRATVDDLYRSEARRIFPTLVSLLGDFDLAEEALHEAFRTALEQWPVEGVPANPRAWLVSVGRFKAIDALRRGGRVQTREDFDLLAEAIPDESESPRERGDRGRPPAPHLHLLPPGACAGRPGGAHAA